jgi:hypothetical protein
MTLQNRVLTIAATAVLLSGCVTHSRVVYDDSPIYVEVDNGQDGHPQQTAPRVPRGHMPPPGACRIWYPDRPPGHQPPPGDCATLAHRVPDGAWLIRG